MENHHFWWENPLFLWPFSSAMLVHQRVNKTETTHQRNHAKPVAFRDRPCFLQVPLTGDMFEFDGVFDMTSSQAQPRSVRFPTSPVFHLFFVFELNWRHLQGISMIMINSLVWRSLFLAYNPHRSTSIHTLDPFVIFCCKSTVMALYQL